MSKRAVVFAAALAACGLAAEADAAPVVDLTLTLLAPDGYVIQPSVGPNGYQPMSPGTHFFVMLGAKIRAGTENFTDSSTGRATATRNQPLGIQNLTVDLLGDSFVHPVATGGLWSNYTDLTPDALAYAFTPVNDANGDTYPDAPGAGFANLGAFSTGTTATSLSKVQYGVTGKTTDYVYGEFFTNFGFGTIRAVPRAVNVYAEDPNNTANNLVALDNLANSNGLTAVIYPPEPGCLGALALPAVALVRRRRN
jgi:hypothetical protein